MNFIINYFEEYGDAFSGRLKASGIDTVKQLGNCNAANLAQKMAAANKQKHLCKTTPNATIVAGWIVQAKILEPMVTHLLNSLLM